MVSPYKNYQLSKIHHLLILLLFGSIILNVLSEENQSFHLNIYFAAHMAPGLYCPGQVHH